MVCCCKLLVRSAVETLVLDAAHIDMAAKAASKPTDDNGSALDKLFAPGGSVKGRLGSEEGLVRFKKIMKAYATSSQQVVVPFFMDSDCKIPNLQRHPINARKQMAVLAKYTQEVLKHGVVQGVRPGWWTLLPESQSCY